MWEQQWELKDCNAGRGPQETTWSVTHKTQPGWVPRTREDLTYCSKAQHTWMMNSSLRGI